MKTLIVKNRKQIETGNDIQDKHIIISIYTPGDSIPVPAHNENTEAMFSLPFHDLDGELSIATSLALGPITLFDDEMAKQIMGFVNCFNEIDTILVHCDAGQSRSAGVAAAIAKFFNGDDNEFFSGGGMYGTPRYTPNRLVYRKILEAFYGIKNCN